MQIKHHVGLPLIALAALGLAVPAHAQFSQLQSAGDLSAGDSAYNYSGANGDVVASPFVQVNPDNTLTFTASGPTLTRIDSDGNSFAFAAGTTLLETTAGGFGPDGPLVIDFATGVTEFGLSAQDFAPDMEAFSVVGYDGNKLLGGFSTDIADNTSDVGTALFLGGKVTGGDVITRLSITSVSSEPGAANDFLIGPVTSAPIPEASTAVSLGLGAFFLGCFFLHTRKKAA